MKKIIALFLLPLMLLLCSCAETGTAYTGSDAEITIVTTLFPAYDFAREVAGDRAEVILIVPPGSEAHSYEPTPGDIIAIRNCSLLFCNGGESEAWLDTVLEGMEGNMKVLRMLDCVEALEEETREGMQLSGEEEGGEETEFDEHVWTSPLNAAAICGALKDFLCAGYPQYEAEFTANCEAYTRQLMELDENFRKIVSEASGDTLVFADRFPVRYFTEEYGLNYYAAFPGCADDTEPSAKTVAFLIDRVREENVPAVLYIEFSNMKMADIISEDTGCGKLLFHSCHNISAAELEAGVTYLELMNSNLTSVKEALG